MRIPTVDVWAEPGFLVTSGKPVTLHATPKNAGPNPKYQWKVNSHPIAGATNDTYTAIFNDYDSISCVVISSGVCANIGTHDWVFISIFPLTTGTVVAHAVDLRIVPNPNNGIFTIRGTLGNNVAEEASVELTNVLGQVVYKGVLTTRQGRVDELIKLDTKPAAGMYLLTLRTGYERKVLYFVLEP